jgi:hypothetical protein
MLKNRKSRLATAVSVCALSLAFAAPAQAQNTAGDSLVNVQLSDITIAVPIGVAANLCDVNVNILAQQERNGGAQCDADATSTATPGQNGGGPGNTGNTAVDSLINVQIDDLEVLVPVAVAANLCDINANVLAAQDRRRGASCTATADSDA